MGSQRILAAVNLAVAGLVLIGVWAGLPARYAPVDVAGTVIAMLFAAVTVGLVVGPRWGRRVAFLASTALLVVGLCLATSLVMTAAHLVGLYGPVGGGGAALLAAVAVMVTPYLVIFPAWQAQTLWRHNRRTAAANAASDHGSGGRRRAVPVAGSAVPVGGAKAAPETSRGGD